MPANQTAKKKKYDMLTDHPGKALFIFALPMIFGNLFQQLYNITDSVIVGRFVGENALAAVGASYAITNVFIAIAIGGGIGSSVIISQFLGGGKDRENEDSRIYDHDQFPGDLCDPGDRWCCF